MTSIPFRLIPYADDGPGTDHASGSFAESLSITGHLSITTDTLEVAYQLQGDLDQLRIPSLASPPERRDLLWQTTCLELFLAHRGANGYWEFNLSPAGHWNVYRLEGYRQGLTPEPAYLQLPFRVKHQRQPLAQHPTTSPGRQIILTLRCPLPPDAQGKLVQKACEALCETAGETAVETICETIGETEAISAGRPGLEVGITAVIEHSDGVLSYWALHHPAAEADFHHRGGFRIQVP